MGTQNLQNPVNAPRNYSTMEMREASQVMDDANRDNIEQERYYKRLKQSTNKQNQIFKKHLEQYYVPLKQREIETEEKEKSQRAVAHQ